MWEECFQFDTGVTIKPRSNENESKVANLHESFLNSHAPVKREQELHESWWELRSESLHDTFLNSYAPVKREQELHDSWWELRSESLHESFLNSYAPVKREQELHESWWELRVCMRVFLNLMPPGGQTRTRVAWESMRVDWILPRAWRKLSSRSVLFP
jgi:hypothetical protein